MHNGKQIALGKGSKVTEEEHLRATFGHDFWSFASIIAFKEMAAKMN